MGNLYLLYAIAARRTLERRVEQVQTEFGPVRIKIAGRGGARMNFVPEYEDCRNLAGEKGVPLKEVLAAASRAFLNTRTDRSPATGAPDGRESIDSQTRSGNE